MAINPIDLDAVTKIVTDRSTATPELLKIIQQLIAIIRDHETRLTGGGL